MIPVVKKEKKLLKDEIRLKNSKMIEILSKYISIFSSAANTLAFGVDK